MTSLPIATVLEVRTTGLAQWLEMCLTGLWCFVEIGGGLQQSAAVFSISMLPTVYSLFCLFVYSSLQTITAVLIQNQNDNKHTPTD